MIRCCNIADNFLMDIYTRKRYGRRHSCGLLVVDGGVLALSRRDDICFFASDSLVPAWPDPGDEDCRWRCWLCDRLEGCQYRCLSRPADCQGRSRNENGVIRARDIHGGSWDCRGIARAGDVHS